MTETYANGSSFAPKNMGRFLILLLLLPSFVFKFHTNLLSKCHWFSNENKKEKRTYGGKRARAPNRPTNVQTGIFLVYFTRDCKADSRKKTSNLSLFMYAFMTVSIATLILLVYCLTVFYWIFWFLFFKGGGQRKKKWVNIKPFSISTLREKRKFSNIWNYIAKFLVFVSYAALEYVHWLMH